MGLAASVGAEVGASQAALFDLQQMFHRFDFDGTGSLDRGECVELVLHMLRVRRAVFRDASIYGCLYVGTPPQRDACTLGTFL